MKNQFLIICSISLILLLAFTTLLILHKSNKQKASLNKTLTLQYEVIRNQREVLQKAKNTKNKLFSILGHDLRDPFSMIIQGLNLIESEELNGQEKSLILSEFKNQVTLVYNLLNNLLYWSQNQLGELRVNKEIVCLKEFMQKIIKELLTLQNQKNISINFNHNNLSGSNIIVDSNHLYIIIRNIINNSIKFSEINGIIDILLIETEKDKIILKIIDYGVGMDSSRVRKPIRWKNFNSEYGTNGEKGYGLGLQLIFEFCEHNSINVDVNSELGKGTAFELQFDKIL